jgi:diaminohydroxyphosphoribosylaminopyrimidine deaminase/5-amino-6-(5-phosphoribosylamino)uracil reductase
MLNARLEGPRKQLRVVIDLKARISHSSRIVQSAKEYPTIIAVHENVSRKLKEKLQDSGCELLELTSNNSAEIVDELLILLGKKGIQNLLVEGGGKTLGSFFDADQVDEIQVYIAPFIIGGSDAISPVAGVGILEMAQRRKIASFGYEMIDDNMLLSGRLKHYESK